MKTKHRATTTYVVFLLAISLMLASVSGIRSSARPESQAPDERKLTPAGELVMDVASRQPAVGALPVDLVHSPDQLGPDGRGRYLVSVNSGFGIQFNSAGNRAQQSLSVIDLKATPAPVVVQNVYFPTPQSANVGLVFAPRPDDDGSYTLYVSGGFENKIWIFHFRPGTKFPITPISPGPNSIVEAPFIDVTGFTTAAASSRYNENRAPVYPTGLAISPDGENLYVANNLGDSLGIISDVRSARKLERVDLRRSTNSEHTMYPYGIVVWSGVRSNNAARVLKLFVSCWNDASIAVVDPSRPTDAVSYVGVGQHPTAMLLNEERTRLFVVNSGDDTVSVIDPAANKEIERINIRLAEKALPGNTPEGLALNGRTLYVANAHSNSIAVVQLSRRSEGNERVREEEPERSTVRGFIPTGNYPSAVAVAAHSIFIGNGKGTGVENSSVVVNNSGRVPNAPNDRFPAGTGRAGGQGGQYSVSAVSGNISIVAEPDDSVLARYTQQVMNNNGLIGSPSVKLFSGASPIKHIIYVIKENRTYDQVFGDVRRSGDGMPADGDAGLAIFGSGDAAKSPGGTAQDITPNHRALATRFGLFDRFFVNSEASPDGHNWSTAAFSSDYVDKAYRWDYGGRGRGYDYEGFNRLPEYNPIRAMPSLFGPSVVAEDVANFMRRYIPYLHGSRDVAEPETLYLWDAAARAGLTYRNYGEFIATLSEADVAAIRSNRSKTYPDLTPTVSAIPTKKALEGHYNESFPTFDTDIPDAMTIDSYKAVKGSGGTASPLVSNTSGSQNRGTSRFGVWLEEFHSIVADREARKADRLPNLSIMRFPNDHTEGIRVGKPTPQFHVADNDYAVGSLVETVSRSPYWKDTAIFVVEDDAQDGPDHVDAHRSVALVISAYNRPGLLVHKFHTTVSMIRTMELLLGLSPMNQLDANAVPMDIFRSEPDLQPYSAVLPNVALDNLLNAPARDAATAYWINRTLEQNMSHPDMADPETLNQIIWFSVRRTAPMPAISRLPVFDTMRLGLPEEREERSEVARNLKADPDN